MTILGDRAQTMDDKQQDVLTFLPKIFGTGYPQDHYEQELPQYHRDCILCKSNLQGLKIWNSLNAMEHRWKRKYLWM